jgi:hypothetical protein
MVRADLAETISAAADRLEMLNQRFANGAAADNPTRR